jgi:hypothetical protein
VNTDDKKKSDQSTQRPELLKPDHKYKHSYSTYAFKNWYRVRGRKTDADFWPFSKELGRDELAKRMSEFDNPLAD